MTEYLGSKCLEGELKWGFILQGTAAMAQRAAGLVRGGAE